MFVRTTKSDFARLGRLQIFSLLHNVQVLSTRILGLPMKKMHPLPIRSSGTILMLLVTSRQGVEWGEPSLLLAKTSTPSQEKYATPSGMALKPTSHLCT